MMHFLPASCSEQWEWTAYQTLLSVTGITIKRTTAQSTCKAADSAHERGRETLALICCYSDIYIHCFVIYTIFFFFVNAMVTLLKNEFERS